MAKGRKPAIDGIARPQGFLDDIVRPVIQKGARKVANKAMVGTSKRSYRIMSAADKLEDKMLRKRASGYMKDQAKAHKKNKSKAYSVANAKATAVMMEQGRKIGRETWVKPRSVRQAAKSARRLYR